MCGIVGAIASTTLSNSVDKFLKNALVVDAVRGAHSTGVCILSQMKGKKYFEVRKSAVNGSEFVANTYDPVAENTSAYCVIGHNRYATVGNIDDDSAHPFHVKDIIGVHNGTLTGDWKKALQSPKHITVDSNAMMHSIMHRGYKKTFESMSGAVATVWTNIRTHRTYVYRNIKRPLFYAVTTNGQLIYGSEKLMLEWLINRNNLTLKTQVTSFKTDMVCEITGGEVVELEEVRTFPEPTVTYGSQSQWTGASDASYWGYSADDITDSYVPPRSNAKSVSTPTVKAGRVTCSVVSPDLTGRYPVYGGVKIPSVATMYGAKLHQIDREVGLPIRVPFSYTDAQLTSLGYRRQQGVFYRGNWVTKYEQDMGIIGEFAEISQKTTSVCDYDGGPLGHEWLETGEITNPIRVNPENFVDFCEENPDLTAWIKVITANTVLELPIGQTA